MNAPIHRLFAVLLLLLALLVGFTSRWAVFESDELRANSDNKRPLIAELGIPRGEIKTSDGVLVARSVPEGRGSQRIYRREYPEGTLFGNPVGFDFINAGRTQIELSLNDTLAGQKNEFATLIEQLQGNAQQGSDLTLTLDASAQQLATDLLDGRPGAVVAIEPSTGAVRVMASVPGFDPNAVPEDTDAEELNRATQARYPPGSTMKVVTAVAALDSGEFDPDSVLNADSPKTISGAPLANSGGTSFGDIPMTTALTNSVNTYFAQVGEQIGPDTLIEYMRRFGFESDPELEYPDGKMIASGVVSRDKLVQSGFDIGRVAIGQGGAEGQLLATPTQMAEVAAAVANGGTLMKPTFVQEVTDADGRTTDELGDGDEQSDVMSEETAAQMAEMMGKVASEGTASALSMSVPFAGKTGTAEIDVPSSLNQPWFIGFAPLDEPRIAIAVTVERCTGCFGGNTAGPIATAVMEDLLR